MGNRELQVSHSQQEKPSLWGILWKPVETLERIRENPRILGALIIVTILMAIGATLTTLGGEQYLLELEQQLYGELPPEAMVISRVVIAAVVFITALFTPVISILIGSAIYLLIAKLVRSPVTFKQLFSMNTYIFLLTGLAAVINGLAAFILKSPTAAVTNLGSLVPIEGALYGLLTSLDVFSIWGVILTAYGLHIVASFSKKMSWTVSILFFIVGMLMAIFGATFDPTLI